MYNRENPIDWWNCSKGDYRGQGGLDAVLAQKKEHLESIVERYIVDGKTAEVIQFRGRKCCISADAYQPAVVALQLLYRLLAAREADDLDAAAEFAIGFGEAYFTIHIEEVFGIDVYLGVIRGQRAVHGRNNRGRLILKTAEQERLFLMTAAQNRSPRGKYGWKAIAEEMTYRHGIKMDAKTASRNHKMLTQTDNGTNVQK